jgi:hypothetical protein
MTIVEPLPVSGYGKADWVDYSNYWREGDAEWLMERTILRYQSPALRTTQWPSPKFGHVTYNETTDRLETYSKTQNSWVQIPQWAYLVSSQDTAAGAAIAHSGAAGKGITFQPARTVMDNPIFVMGGVLTVDATGLTVKTGAKTVKLTTDATSLVSDSPISATGLTSTGALSAVSATLTGSLTVPNITMSGTLGGGVLNGTTGTIGGVAMATNTATASGGFISQAGLFQGDSASALMRYRNPSGGALGSQYIQAANDNITFGPTNAPNSVYMYPFLRIMQGRGIPWHNAAGTHVAWISPTIVSGGDPGAGNYPDGTIWVQP